MSGKLSILGFIDQRLGMLHPDAYGKSFCLHTDACGSQRLIRIPCAVTASQDHSLCWKRGAIAQKQPRQPSFFYQKIRNLRLATDFPAAAFNFRSQSLYHGLQLIRSHMRFMLC